MSSHPITEIKTKYNILSLKQKVIADFILNHHKEVILLTITDLAEQCKTSETTIIRFIRKLGYSSYQIFKVMMAQERAASSPQTLYEDIKRGDTAREIINKVIFSTVSSIDDLKKLIDDNVMNASVDLFSKAHRILFFGTGGSATIAQDAFNKFLRLGLNVIHDQNRNMMSVYCAHTGIHDLLFLVSHSGESGEIIRCASLAKENGAKIIALTSYRTSSLTKLADVTLLSSTNETKIHTDAMVSRIIQLVIIDIVYVGLVLRMEQQAIDKINKSRLAVADYKT